MGTDTSKPDRQAALPQQHRSIKWHWPALLALLAIGAIYAVISEQFSPGPPGLLLIIIIVLVIPFTIAVRRERFHLTRMLALVLLGLVTLSEAVSASFLVIGLIASPLRLNEVPHDRAIVLLRDAALIWLVNILTFSLWYWEVDGGGPGRRHREGYHPTDFAFPQITLEHSPQTWCPHFLDYLFLAFNTSTAFSPTDTMVLSRRAKVLMMTQALISLVVLAIIAARAINTL